MQDLEGAGKREKDAPEKDLGIRDFKVEKLASVDPEFDEYDEYCDAGNDE